MADDTLVHVNHLWHSYNAGGVNDTDVLQDIELEIRHKEIIAVVGPSGCGKTTLLNLLSGTGRPSKGSLRVSGREPVAGSPDIGVMFARDALLPWRTAVRNVELGMEIRNIPSGQRRERARQALADVGLALFHGKYPAELSQGMRQRVALARTFALEPKLLLMDEPFAALDAQTKILVQDKFVQLKERRDITVLLITHDLAEAIALADRVVLMTRGPGRVRTIHQVNLPRPRSILSLQGDPEFHAIYEKLWNELREEVNVENSP